MLIPDRLTRYLNDEDYLTEEEMDLNAGNAQILLIDRIFVKSIENLINNIFGYKNISITKSKAKKTQAFSGIIFEEKNSHSCCKFSIETFNQSYYDFEIENIPALFTSKHISVFFQVIVNLMNNFYQVIELHENIETLSKHYFVSIKNSFISEHFIYNLERTIILEYLFYLFNDTDNNYQESSQGIRYGLELIQKIHDFCLELSTKRVENEDIYCGFIFHDEKSHIDLNSVNKVELDEPIEFGNFGKLKKILQVTNGQNIFFNVTNKFITGFFITKQKIKEIFYNIESENLSFKNRPLIVSIQGEGNINYVEGQEKNNPLLLQILNSAPKIKDREFIKNKIKTILAKIKGINKNSKSLNSFLEWLLSLSLGGHGTSIIIGNFEKDEVKKLLVKSTEIHYPQFKDFKDKFNIEMLNHLVKPDGAIIFSEKFQPLFIGSILSIPKENSKNISGGARHNSMLNFSLLLPDGIGIAISEDGPITVFKNGKEEIKY